MATSSMSEPSAWQLVDLPQPMLAHIAGFLERPHDKASLAGCCRALHNQSGSWWQGLCLHLRSDHQAALLAHWFDGTQPAIYSLHLEATRTGLLEVAFGLPSPQLPALRDLTLKGGVLYDGRLMDSMQQQTQLTSLTVRMVGSLAGVQVTAPASMLQIRSLSLSGFRVSLPANISRLSALTALDLSHSGDHSAASLSHHLAGLSQLVSLNLACCGLSDIPPAVSTLSRLESLSLRWNVCLAGGLEHLFGLQKLTCLDLRQCGLHALAPAVSTLTSLQRLGLSSNRQLSAGLEYLDGLGRLTSLYLSKCGFSALPSAVSTLTALQRLDVAGNRSLTAGLDHLAGLRRLSSLRLGGCALTELPPAFSTLIGLRKLELNGNARLVQGLQHLAGLPYLTSMDRAGCGSVVAVSCLPAV